MRFPKITKSRAVCAAVTSCMLIAGAIDVAPASAAECKSGTMYVGQPTPLSVSACADDFSAKAGVEFTGKIGSVTYSGTYADSFRTGKILVSWGDGSTQSEVKPQQNGDIVATHTYATAKSYAVNIQVPALTVKGNATVTPPVTVVSLPAAESAADAAKWQKETGRQTRKSCKTYTGPFTEGQCGSFAEGADALDAGKAYTLGVAGTISYWDWKTSDAKCGQAPVEVGRGYATGIDALWRFSTPTWRGSKCRKTAKGPLYNGSVAYSLDGGQSWDLLNHLGQTTTPSADHTYSFTVTGQGQKPMFRLPDHQPTNNHGAYTFTYAPMTASATR